MFGGKRTGKLQKKRVAHHAAIPGLRFLLGKLTAGELQIWGMPNDSTRHVTVERKRGEGDKRFIFEPFLHSIREEQPKERDEDSKRRLHGRGSFAIVGGELGNPTLR